MKPKALWNPYLGGVILGLVLLATFLLMGFGLGSSGAAARAGYAATYAVAPGVVEQSPYLSQYVGPGLNPLDNWLVFLVIGVFLGGLVSSILAGRNDKAIIKGDVSDQTALEKIIVAAGNITGISKVETQVSAVDEKEPVLHTVAKGDTLWKIAQKHYGNGSRYTAIFEANKPMLSDPDKIYPGQVLRIPEA